ncbi:MAG TPA: TetR family transcriptional regulator C-terminal domain-containing protein [Gaiellaceae bacterium]|nr:TetR family transcriptional regulator C-terminal domain-containing protein [Gaiellaceae bacterium]
MAAATPLERLEALCERFLSHVERAVFPGGCFFASVAAELDTRPGPVRDRAAEVVVWWSQLHHTAIVEAQAVGELDPAEDAAQLGYEIGSLLLFANASYLLGGGADALERGRRGITRRLELARPPVAGRA